LRRLFGDFTPQTMFQRPDSLVKQAEELSQAAEKGVEEILTKDQLKRLGEISLQQRGGHALGDPEVAKALGLTEEQTQRIQKIQPEALQQMQTLALEQWQGMFEKGGKPLQTQNAFARIAKRFQELTRTTGESLLEVLTPEQETRWRELKGKPFKGGGR